MLTINSPATYPSTKENLVCPICGDVVEKLVYRWHYESEEAVLNKIREGNPGWMQDDGSCSRCVDYYQIRLRQQNGLIPEAGPFFSIKSVDDFLILPTAVRLDADPRYTGKGVTICFIDSGFTLHPDLMKRQQRVKVMVDVTGEKTKTVSSLESMKRWVKKQKPSSIWHGTMTTCACAGDGFLSRGLYKGIASDAELVLIRTMDENNHITSQSIVKALLWVKKNHRKYNIRIVNMSLGDDVPASFRQSRIDALAEELVEKGITIVAAVGNEAGAAIKPPANSPQVIAVGGLDDENKLNGESKQLYHSAFGKTIDNLSKPDLIAPAIWVAVPIPHSTIEFEESQTLYELWQAKDEELLPELKKKIIRTRLDKDLTREINPAIIREKLLSRIQQCKYVSANYQHVDGTSFAAPIVCSVIAQLLEIQPALTPHRIRELLLSTAERLAAFPVERQGFGALNPRKALQKLSAGDVHAEKLVSPNINRNRKEIRFCLHEPQASAVTLAGTFNNWNRDELLMRRSEEGTWSVTIPLLSPGTHLYKFLVDGTDWREDFLNPYREPDGLGGWNGVIEVAAE